MIEFEVTDAADQQFAAVLQNRRVTIRLRYNVSLDRWSMDVAIDDLPVLHGRRIVTGIDLLAPFGLGIGAIFAMADKPGAVPDRDSLPRGMVKLYHASEAEIEEAIKALLPLVYSPPSALIVDDEYVPLTDDDGLRLYVLV